MFARISRPLLFCSLVCSVLAFSGCGQKGPLKEPEPQAHSLANANLH